MLTADMKRTIREQRLGFVATVNADGTPNVSPKATFVVIDDRSIAFGDLRSPGTIRNLKAHDVNVRLMGDFAIIHARTSYTTADGAESGGRYTDVWARRNGKWLAVSAHVTRK